MPNISGLYTALSGLNAQRRVLDVTAHNIANETTPGYHRQRVELQPAGVPTVAAVFAGPGARPAGVDAVGVTRVVDQLAEDRMMRENALQAGTRELSTALDRIELAFVEPSDQGIAAVLDEFWAGWSDLSAHPTDVPIRSQLLERGQTVVDALNRAATDLDHVQDLTRQQISDLAVEVNELTSRLGQLNAAIVGSASAPNDLLDQRDVVLNQLAELTGAVARPGQGGAVDVYIGGRVIVSGTIALGVTGDTGELRWAADASPVALPPSRLGSMAQIVDEVIPRYRAALDAVADRLVTQVNALHVTGLDLAGADGRNFFEPGAPVTAASIALSSDVAGHPEHIAAAAPSVTPGQFDGELARTMAALADTPSGADVAYRSLVSGLGVEVRAAGQRADIQEQVAQAATTQASSVGGVSLDEEMANLIAAQRAYEASARVLTAVDDLLETLIQRTGVVGR